MTDISIHAKKRIRQRMGKFSPRYAQLALDRGITRQMASGGFRRYLDSYILSGACADVRVYDNEVFLFDQHVSHGEVKRTILITTIPLSAEHQRLVKKIKEKRA